MFSYHSWIVVLIFSLRYGTTHTCCPSVANPPLCNKHTSAKKGGLLGKRKNGLRNCCSTPSRAAQILRTLETFEMKLAREDANRVRVTVNKMRSIFTSK